MTIQINQNSLMHAAIDLCNRGRYLEALPIFAQVDSYESALNQIAILCALEEDYYAAELYRHTKQKYGQTYALYADTALFGNLCTMVWYFCEPDAEYARQTDGALHANRDLIAQIYFATDNAYYDEEMTESFFSTDGLDFAPDFCDVNSPQYVPTLRARFENALAQEDKKAINALYKIVMALNCDNLETLELKLALIAYRQKVKGKQVVAVAQKFAEQNAGSMLCKITAFQIILENNPNKNFDVLTKLVRQLLVDAEKISAFQLCELVYTANDVLRDVQLAYQFAKVLYHKNNLILDDYKVCATVFFNYGDLDLSREAMLTLLRLVPTDLYARFWTEFISSASYKTPALQVGKRSVRYFLLPHGVFAYASTAMGQKLFETPLSLDENDYRYLKIMFLYMKSLLISGDESKYQEISAGVRALLHTVPPQNVQDFCAFAKENLLTLINDHLINQTLMCRLMELGCRDKVFLGLTDGYQVVDLSVIPEKEEELYLPLSIALSIQKADIFELIKAYYTLKPIAQAEEIEVSPAHNFAYAMLALANAEFVKTDFATFFDDSEKVLYNRYLDFLKAQR